MGKRSNYNLNMYHQLEKMSEQIEKLLSEIRALRLELYQEKELRKKEEKKNLEQAELIKKLIEENVFYADGSPAEVVISPCTIGGGKEAATCAAAQRYQCVLFRV